MFALIAMAAGALLNAYNQKRAQDARNSALTTSIGHQQQYQQQIGQALNERLTKLTGQQSDPAAVTNDYLDAVKNAMGSYEVPDYSDAYTEASNAHQTADRAHVNQLAHLMGSLQAPLDLRREQGYDTADLASRIAMLANQARGQAGVDKIGVSGIRANPYTSMLAQGLYSYGANNATFGG